MEKTEACLQILARSTWYKSMRKSISNCSSIHDLLAVKIYLSPLILWRFLEGLALGVLSRGGR